jgi:hypothetical protein
MKVVFWCQIIISVSFSALQSIQRFMGIPMDVDLNRYSWTMFLISGGFLWIHHAIVAPKVKP